MMPARKVTMDQILAAIKKTEYVYIDTLTLCVLTLTNGSKVTGESACIDERIYNRALGEEMAYEKALDKIWPLEGYVLANEMMNAATLPMTFPPIDIPFA